MSFQAVSEGSPRSQRKAKGDGHLRRGEILKAAEEIFIAHGYEGATIRKIAEEVGVSSTALYMHFRDKDEILVEICSRAMGELLAVTTEIARRPEDPVRRVRAILQAYVRFALANPNAYRLAFCAASKAGGAAGASRMGLDCFERFSRVVAEIARQGRLLRGDAATAAQALWAACHGLASLMLAKPEIDWAPSETLADVTIEGALFGLVSD